MVKNVARQEMVAEQAARLVLLHGIDAVTHARLARASGVSRPWLYKYIGRERADLVRFMTRHFGLRLAEFDNRPRTDRREHWIEDTVDGVRIMVESARAAPWVLPLYFRYVGTKNAVGECIAHIEERYLATCTEEVSLALGVAEPRARWCAELIHAMRMGVVHRHVSVGFTGDPELDQLWAQLRRWIESL